MAGREPRKSTVKRATDQVAPPLRSGDPLFVQSVEKALKVLSLFGATRPMMSISQISHAAEMDRSAAQRFTHTLEKLGYLEKDDDTKRYSLSTKALDIGYAYIRSNAIVDHSLQYLLHLSDKIQEGVNLAVLDDTEVVVISRIASRHMLNNNHSIGTRLPAYCTAAGIAILSHLPRDAVLDRLNRSNLKKYTEHTTSTIPDLIEKIELSRSQGYAVSCEERQFNDLSIAAAVLDAKGNPIAAVTIAVSKLNHSATDLTERFAAVVQATAVAISPSD